MKKGMNGSAQNWMTGIKNFVLRNLTRPYIHYSSHLPIKAGVVSLAIRNYLFRNIQFNPKQLDRIRSLPDDSIIVYASKYRSHFEYIFFYTRFQGMGLPYPSIGFDYSFILWQPFGHFFKIVYSHVHYFLRHFYLPDPFLTDHIRAQLLGGRSALMTLIGKESFYKRFVKEKTDPIQYLIDMQLTTDRTIYIIPELVFFSNKPQKMKLSFVELIFGTQERPGKLRRIVTLLGRPKRSFVELIEPISIKQFLERPDIRDLLINEQAALFRRELISGINRHRQAFTGPLLKSREELKENILTNDDLKQFLIQHAMENDLPLREVNKKADGYLEEIAANFSAKWIMTYKVVLEWLFKNLFEGIVVDLEGLARVREMSVKAPLILIPCHKSHLDYLILSYFFYKYNLPCPHIAAGKNLSFWPMGTIFRGGGAFFMRRTFKGAELYAKIFSEYIKKLLSEGFNIELFIEGTRSRTGKLLPPKFGLLSIIIDAFRERACEDLLFVPVFFGYDRVLEEDAYLHEVEGGEKEPESVSQILKARRVLKRRYGKVYVNFHDPISMNEYLQGNQLDFYNQDREAHNELCRSLGFRLIQSIQRVALATPYGVVASAILNSPKKRFTHEQLMADIDMYMVFMISQGVKLSDTLLQNKDWAIKSVISNYVRRKFIDINVDSEEDITSKTIYKINAGKRPILGYYKNNCIGFFVSASYTALSILKLNTFKFKHADLVETYNYLKVMFDKEFTYDRETKAETLIRKDIKAFINDKILTPHPTVPDTYDITAEGYRKLNCFASFLKTYMESYMVALAFFKRYPENTFEGKTAVKKTLAIGRRMFKAHEVDLPESLSEISFKNAVSYFTAHGLNEPGSEDRINRISETIHDYISLIQL